MKVGEGEFFLFDGGIGEYGCGFVDLIDVLEWLLFWLIVLLEEVLFVGFLW